eukprot:587275-Rhodomonas_salina.1
MVLGHPLCFEIGIYSLEFLDLDWEAAVCLKHSSDATFREWNNDMELEISQAAEQLKPVLENGWEGLINNKDHHSNALCKSFENHHSMEPFKNHAMTQGQTRHVVSVHWDHVQGAPQTVGADRTTRLAPGRGGISPLGTTSPAS